MGKVKNLKWKGEKSMKISRGPHFYHFLKPLKFVFGVYQNENFYWKTAFDAGKKSAKVTFPT